MVPSIDVPAATVAPLTRRTVASRPRLTATTMRLGAALAVTTKDAGSVTSYPLKAPSSASTISVRRTERPASSGPEASTLGWASAAGARATSAVAQAPRSAAARLLHRTLTTLGVLLALLTAGAGTASAHTVGGTGSSNFHTVLGALSPATPGVSATVIEDGNRIQLTNTTATDLVVLGYDGEPFLRVGPAGTFHNKLSASYYYNIDRFGGTPGPTYADDKAAPVWVRDSTSDVARFHDHNTHYMSTDLPPLVRAAPGQPQLVSDWTVPMTYGGRSLAITGQLRWVPGPSPLPWYALALLTGLGAAALALTRRGGRLVVAAVLGVRRHDAVTAPRAGARSPVAARA